MKPPRALSPQLALVREAVKQFPDSTVAQLQQRTLIPRAILYRRLVELVRSKHLRKINGAYSIVKTPEETGSDDGMALRKRNDLRDPNPSDPACRTVLAG
jgi:hypothetical protein